MSNDKLQPTPETDALFMVLPRGLGAALAQMMAHAQKLERERDALKSATTEHGWQPIETAPKEGAVEQLLLYVPTLHGTGGKVIAHWAHGGGEEQPRFGPAWFFWTGFDFHELRDKPTHWMRLPHCPADWRKPLHPYVSLPVTGEVQKS